MAVSREPNSSFESQLDYSVIDDHNNICLRIFELLVTKQADKIMPRS